MISATKLIKTFPGTTKPVIQNIDLEIKNGEFISMVGRSGSGKSTLLYLLSTLDRQFDGDVLYDGRSIKAMGSEEVHQLRNKEIGFVFQFHYLLSELTALENVLLPTKKGGSTNEHAELATYLLKEVGLEEKMNSLPATLSGGEQQRVAIARSLIMKPHYIFADEPTGNLDSHNGDLVMQLFLKFNKEFGTTIIYVTHDKEFADLARRKIHLLDGKLE